MMYLWNYVDGTLKEASDGGWFPVHEPATGEVYAMAPDSRAEDIDAAIEAALSAFSAWSTSAAAERSRLMHRIADLMQTRLEDFAQAESRDTGKPVWLARMIDIPRAIDNFRFFAGAILHSSSEAHQTDTIALNYTLRQPIGIAGCISPWNLPLYLFTWKIAPALAAGNCVVAKPSEITPATASLFAEICMEARLPAGVLNIVHGSGENVGAAITTHPDIAAVSFTGGTATGATIARNAAPLFKKLSLELGGKNAALVFADCDFEETVETVVGSAFSNQGEVCLCSSRIFIERPLYERFRDAFVERVRELTVGDPLDDSTRQGALISPQHMEKVLSYIALAREEGGRILCGGERVQLEGRCAGGAFFSPTVIEGLPYNCRTNQEEIFGPVATLLPFDSEAEVLTMANATRYGLAASVWTSNLTRAHRVAAALQAGIVWVNCWMLRDLRTPFGGMKQSGVGREGGWEALHFFTEAKNVCIKL
ncbi:MAG: aldehyde dehydrogenase [Bacteroidetes bacterium]|nr:aldehyde dehydrogenase [Bacteroidota bacterium]